MGLGRPSLVRDVVERRAPAKVNLALSVGAAREDGMHPIASWMARVDLADELEVTRLEEGYLSRYAILWHSDAAWATPIDWSITRDLAVRAHLALEEEVGEPLPVQMKLSKRIPVGGGLGGGSADAAAMLSAVVELFGLEVSRERLVEIAMGLGSDVAYFLEPGAAYVGGLGDEVERTGAVSGDVVLVMPRFGCATGAVYRRFDERACRGLREDEVRAMARGAVVDPGSLFNDLGDAAVDVSPRLGDVIEGVEGVSGGAPVHVSGSGSTLFVVCDGVREARRLAGRVEEALGEDVRARAVGFVGEG